MIEFSEIYYQAISLFDDPDITMAYDTNKIQFNKLMYPFLNSSMALFNNPFMIAPYLLDYTKPDGKMEIFESDGESKRFSLSFTPLDGSLFDFHQNGVKVDAIIEEIDDIYYVEFPDVIEAGKEYSVEAYYPGRFNSDFKITGTQNIDENIRSQVISILARLLVRSWSEDKRNFLLDIENILTDTDFKLHPASPALRSKNEWVKTIIEETHQLQNKLGHNIRFSSSANWGRRFL